MYQAHQQVWYARGRMGIRQLVEYLREHPCIDCGEQDPVVLDFDHVDRSDKRKAVSFLTRSGYPWATVMAEVDKCQVRCANCHRRRTAIQFEWPKLACSLERERHLEASGPGGTRTPETSRMRTERSPN